MQCSSDSSITRPGIDDEGFKGSDIARANTKARVLAHEKTNIVIKISNAIPVHIHHLRRKLAEVGATPVIHTVRGIGYLLAEKPV